MADATSTNVARRRTAPLFLIKPGSMTPKDIRRVEKLCGIVVAECKEAQAVRLLDPPIDAEIDLQARAALRLFRYIKDISGNSSLTFYRNDLVKWFVDMLMEAPVEAVQKVKK